jgi:hypothetical protein
MNTAVARASNAGIMFIERLELGMYSYSRHKPLLPFGSLVSSLPADPQKYCVYDPGVPGATDSPAAVI